jgi:uncharacterized membrane protein
MFDLTISKGKIKRELVHHYKTLIPMMVVPILALFAYSIITLMSSDNLNPSIIVNIIGLFIAPILLSFTLIGIQYSRYPQFYTTRRYSKVPGINDMSDYFDTIIMSFLVGLLTFLWALLFIVPGIIKAFSYSQAILIYLDNKHSGNHIGYLTAITESRQLMDGNKFNYFLFELSFIGWMFSIMIGIFCGIMLAGFALAQTGILMIALFILSVLVIFLTVILILFVTFYISFGEASYYDALINQ